METHFLTLATIAALFIFGLHAVTRDGELLGFVERFWWHPNPRLDKWNEAFMKTRDDEEGIFIAGNPRPPEAHKLPISKPITECPLCMSSLWGSTAVLSFGLTHWGPVTWLLWPVFCLTVAGIITVITWLVE